MQKPQLKCAVFVDHDNFVYGQDRTGIKYGEIMKYLEEKGMVVIRANTYLAVDTHKETVDTEYREEQHEYRDEIRKSGFKVITKRLQYFMQDDGSTRTKGNVDLMLGVDALTQTDNVDCVYIGTGDGDFVQVITALQNRGKRVVCFGVDNISRDLFNTADQYISRDSNKMFIARMFPTFKTDQEKVEARVEAIAAAAPVYDAEAKRKEIQTKMDAKKAARDNAAGVRSTLQLRPTTEVIPSTVSLPDFEDGVILKWFYDKGYGFIEPDKGRLPDNQGLFFHVANVRNYDGMLASNNEVEDHFRMQMPVRFRRIKDGNDIRALQITLLDKYT